MVNKGAYIPQALRKETKKHIEDLEHRGIIRRSSSEWRNPIRSIKKPNGKIRFVQNLMMLNDLREKDPYELKTMKDVIDARQGKEYFIVLDFKEGFYSIEIEEEDKKKIAFEFNRVVYEWNSMMMGFKNAPQVMQKVMNFILETFSGKGLDMYMDDIIICGKTREEHDKLVDDVSKKMIENNMKVNEKKIQYALGEMGLLGVRINGKKQRPTEMKKNEALSHPVPKKLKKMRRFLDLPGCFRALIKDFAKITVNMTNSLRNSSGNWKRNDKMDNGFIELKKAIKEMKERILADYNREFTLKTDASNV